MSIDPLATSAEPYIMDTAPLVLSVVMRISKDIPSCGYMESNLCLVRLDGLIVPLDVKGDTPYLRRYGKRIDVASQERAVRLCGVSQVDGVLFAQRELPAAVSCRGSSCSGC